MRYFRQADETCDTFLPGLRKALKDVPLSVLESPDSPAIRIFREAGGPNLLVPAEHGGAGVNALEATRVIRALGAVAPSMTVGTMMHHFSLGTLYAVADSVAGDSDLKTMLGQVVSERLLVASGFAEGRTNQGILSPTLMARPVDGGYLLTGSKKPCSLSRSMNLLTASVGMPQEDGSTAMGFLLLPADTEGVSVRPFWSNPALAGAESDEVRLEDVFVTDEQIVQPEPGQEEALDELQTVGLIWFQMMIAAGYTGITSALVRQVLEQRRGSATDRATLGIRLGGAVGLVESLARTVDAGEVDNDALGNALVVRFAVQDALADIVRLAVELLGGMAYITSADSSCLATAAQAIAFHPPSRTSMAEGLTEHWSGQPVLVG
ncbi:acyl-CoA dehydrogenase family protein [Streptomyces sp. NPDC002773]|uniref:acyl-CoA dehydrogenase family protein n=1 Tax=Streptomyces sp. NPDC002773 TaxID=3154430 RepID=UPI00332E89D4